LEVPYPSLKLVELPVVVILAVIVPITNERSLIGNFSKQHILYHSKIAIFHQQ
jgi:hypothetical protein